MNPWYCDLCGTYVWRSREEHDSVAHEWDEEEETVC